MDKNKTKFNQWVQLAECKTLKPNQRIILISILNLHNIEGWDFTPLSVLNERSGIGITALKDNLSKLCKLELVEKVSNHNRKKYGKAPNDYVPNYTNILNLLNSQVVGNRPFKDNQIVGKRPINRSENDHLLGRKTTIRIIEEKKEKNNSLYNSTYNDSTRRYMVYPDNDNKQKTNDMDIIITNNPENGNPINALHDFDFSDFDENPNSLEVLAAEREETESNDNSNTAGTHNPNDMEEDTAGTTETAHSEVLDMQVDSYPTHAEKTPQERNIEVNWNKDTAAEDTHSPNNVENTAPTTNTLSIEETQRIMSAAVQTVMKNRKHAAADTQNAPNNDRGEEIIPQADNYTTAAEKTPQGAKNSGMAADTAATEHGADTAAATVWGIRNTADICWQETFEYAAADFVNPTESKIRTLLNKVYKDWRNTDPKNNKKMITEMKNYISYKYHINLDTEVEKRNNDNNSDAYPTADEIEKLSVCHISKNMDILNRLSAGCTRLDTVISSLNKAIEFTQIYRIATPQQYDCITNAMSILDKCPTVSDKKSKYITDLATHLCDMLEKVC